MKVLILQQGQWESICELLSGQVILSPANVCPAVQEGQIIILLCHSRFSSFTFMPKSLICKMHSTIETHPLLHFCSCVNGNCTSPSSCSCYPGWTGPHCTQICRLLIIVIDLWCGGLVRMESEKLQYKWKWWSDNIVLDFELWWPLSVMMMMILLVVVNILMIHFLLLLNYRPGTWGPGCGQRCKVV